MSVFKGWIPTSTGRLSFSHIGISAYPNAAARRSITFSDGVFLVCTQHRNSSDTTEAFGRHIKSLIDWASGVEGNYFFICVANSDAQFDKLEGKIYKFTQSTWNSSGKDIINNLLGAFPEEEISLLNYKGKRDEALSSLDKLSKVNGNHDVNFTLWRNGEFSIEFYEKDYKFDPDFDLAASSIYRFFRDICHTHQHHEDTSDLILDIYPVDRTSSTDHDKWRNETLYSLMRWVIHSKRQKVLSSYQDALGVIAYARSFYKMFNKYIVDGNPQKQLSSYNFDELESSLGHSRDKSSIFSRRWSNWVSFSSLALSSITFILFCLSIIIHTSRSDYLKSLVIDKTINLESTEYKILSVFLGHLYENPISVPVVLILLCVFPFYVLRTTIGFRGSKIEKEWIRLFLSKITIRGRNLTRVCQLSFIILLVLLAVALVGVGVRLMFSGDTNFISFYLAVGDFVINELVFRP